MVTSRLPQARPLCPTHCCLVLPGACSLALARPRLCPPCCIQAARTLQGCCWQGHVPAPGFPSCSPSEVLNCPPSSSTDRTFLKNSLNFHIVCLFFLRAGQSCLIIIVTEMCTFASGYLSPVGAEGSHCCSDPPIVRPLSALPVTCFSDSSTVFWKLQPVTESREPRLPQPPPPLPEAAVAPLRPTVNTGCSPPTLRPCCAQSPVQTQPPRLGLCFLDVLCPAFIVLKVCLVLLSCGVDEPFR